MVFPRIYRPGLGRAVIWNLVQLSAGHKNIVLYSYPGKERFYKKLSFKRMSTAMAIFENQAQALGWGWLMRRNPAKIGNQQAGKRGR